MATPQMTGCLPVMTPVFGISTASSGTIGKIATSRRRQRVASGLLPAWVSDYTGVGDNVGRQMAMWQFWLVAAAMVGVVMAVLIRALRSTGTAVISTTGIYRDQLAEIDRDLARGTLAPEDAARLRLEVSRRLLEADRATPAPSVAAKGAESAIGPLVLIIAIVMAGSAWAYLRLGAPGYPDLPLTERLARADAAYLNRPTQAQAEAAQPATTALPDPDLLALTEKLRTALETRPDDLKGLDFLVRNEVALGRYPAAHAAQSRRIAVKGAQATADDHALLAELQIIAAGGQITAEAEAALVAALTLDPENGTARYYSGLMFAQTGRPDRAFGLWRRLLADSQPGAPWVAPIRAQITQLAAAAGEPYTLPPLPGPTEADIAASQDLSEADRTAMIQGMVAQLSDRLAAEGGPPADWARLITSLGVLGQTDQARAILTEAQALFADQPAAMTLLGQAAKEAGIAP